MNVCETEEADTMSQAQVSRLLSWALVAWIAYVFIWYTSLTRGPENPLG